MSILGGQTLDGLLFNLASLKQKAALEEIASRVLDGDFKGVLGSHVSKSLWLKFVDGINKSQNEQGALFRSTDGEESVVELFLTGLAAFNAFLQANVTGPPKSWEDVLPKVEDSDGLRESCFKSLEVDGVSVYQHIPLVEFFCFARMVFTVLFPRVTGVETMDCRWMRIRINAYHQRLLSGLSGGKLSDSTMLQDIIEGDLKALEQEIMGEKSHFGTEAKCQFLIEKAQIYIMQGLDYKAKENLESARKVSRFSYTLSGALGKRTKFQQNDLSQLVVFARSFEDEKNGKIETLGGDLVKSTLENRANRAPEALKLNDDTLLERIDFAKTDKFENTSLPAELKDLKPDEQPQLKPLDQIILLTEATLKDTLSPLDKLNSEEILPYAVRVLSDKPTNWQIYTQALLVRSRIESHRSRTQERSVLQLQVIVDQIIADTQEEPSAPEDGIPEIRVTSFLPRAKITESAPITERLKYIYQLNTPTRWEIETELAFAWAGAGSLVSALEIFKRLKLWAEVALCYHSVNQESKARQIVRKQLFFSTKGKEMDKYDIDASEIAHEEWSGEQRPTPAHSPRLWCILGDLDNDPGCWIRAWEISKHRYARAQRSLGEYYTKAGDLEQAREAYMQATIVNRQNNDSWSRLGDIDLATGNWDGAVAAFQQSIMIDETDAKTYSNLGSALLSKHGELIRLQKAAAKDLLMTQNDDGVDEIVDIEEQGPNPRDVLRQALQAYKRGASLAHNNWKIWDNVVTIAMRMQPPSYPDLLLGFRAVITIRSPSVGEEAVDIEVLRVLINEVITRDRGEEARAAGVYVPPRGSLARAVMGVVDDEVVPLITKRGELWTLVEKLSLYKRDYPTALSCAEKAWRITTQAEGEKWLQDVEAWKGVVAITDNLISAYENYGPQETDSGVVEKAWKTKARSAIRGVLSRARDAWEGTSEWELLEERMEELKS